MKVNNPFVSVIITVYNGMPFLKDTIDALLVQTYHYFEIIVVNDGSNDGTASYLATLNDKRIKIFHENRIGRGKSLNIAIKKSKGKYIAINDADDISYPTRLEKQVEFLEKKKDYGLVGSNIVIHNLKTGKNQISKKPEKNPDIRKFFTIGQPIQHSAVLYRRDIYDEIGGYNEKISFLFDREIFLRIAAISKIQNLEVPLVEILRHENQFFLSGFKGLKRELVSLKYRIKAIHSFDFPKWWIIREILRSGWTFVPFKIRQFVIKQIKKLK